MRRGDAENALAETRLPERVGQSGRQILPALNLADAAAWPPEPGVLVPGADDDEARVLAVEFGQLACVCGERGAAPRLVWAEADARRSPAS